MTSPAKRKKAIRLPIGLFDKLAAAKLTDVTSFRYLRLVRYATYWDMWDDAFTVQLLKGAGNLNDDQIQRLVKAKYLKRSAEQQQSYFIVRPSLPTKPARPYIANPVRRALLSVAEKSCGICRQPIGPAEVVHIDHILPVAWGGKSNIDNLQVAHALCNFRKGAGTQPPALN